MESLALVTVQVHLHHCHKAPRHFQEDSCRHCRHCQEDPHPKRAMPSRICRRLISAAEEADGKKSSSR